MRRFHDLRHFFASSLIDQGESPKLVQDQLGHKSIDITFDVYGHLFDKDKARAAARLQERLFGSGSAPIGSTVVAESNQDVVN